MIGKKVDELGGVDLEEDQRMNSRRRMQEMINRPSWWPGSIRRSDLKDTLGAFPPGRFLGRGTGGILPQPIDNPHAGFLREEDDPSAFRPSPELNPVDLDRRHDTGERTTGSSRPGEINPCKQRRSGRLIPNVGRASTRI